MSNGRKYYGRTSTCTIQKQDWSLHGQHVLPKAQQLQEIATDGELTDLPSYAEEMINSSLNDIPTPNFGEGFSTYQEYLHGQFE